MPVQPPNTIAAKPVAKFDRFHADSPEIPGVNHAPLRAADAARDTKSKRLAQIGGIAAAALVAVIAILMWMKSTSHQTEALPKEAVVSELPVPEPELPPSTAGRETVAATSEELGKPWAAKQFTFVKPFSHENVDAMVIRLPGGSLWAFALQEPYGHCQLEFVTDLSLLASQHSYRASHPMVVNPCSNTVYDPMKVGSLSGNVWARGEIVQGAGLRPPLAINVRVDGNKIIADRME